MLGGVYALVGSFSMAELGAMLPRSGGYYVFARRAFGEYPAFIVGWTDWLAQCGSTAAVSIVVAEYTADLFPRFAGHNPALASLVAIVMALLQWRGIRWGSITQNLTSAIKALAFFILIAAIFIFAPRSSVQGALHSLPAGMTLTVAFILALQAVIYTYDGWYGIIYFGEEVQDPGRSVPRSMFGGVLSVMAIYVFVNLALVYALPLSQIAGSDLPLGKAMEVIFGARGDTLLRALMIISMLSGINAYHLMASRIPFAMSEDGLLTRHMARVNKGGTPILGLLLSAAAAVAFILTGSFEKVIAIMAFFFVADYAMAYAAVFVLRHREPDLPRPYRAWGYPWTTALVLIGSIAFLIGAVASDRENSRHALIVLAASYPLYLLVRLLRRRTMV